MDGFGQVGVETRAQNLRSVSRHGRGGNRHARYVAGRRIVPQLLEYLDAVDIGKPDVQDDQVGSVLVGKADARFGGTRLERSIPAVL